MKSEYIAALTSCREDAPSINPLTAHLLVDPDDDRGICYDFITEAVRRFGEDETVKEALVGAIEDLSRQLSKITMVDNYKPYIHVRIILLPFSESLVFCVLRYK